MNLEELMAEVKAKGFTITQWRERMTYPARPNDMPKPIGDWWCELRHPKGHRGSETGGTAFTALANAYERAQGKRGPENRPDEGPLVAAEEPKKKKAGEPLDFLD